MTTPLSRLHPSQLPKDPVAAKEHIVQLYKARTPKEDTFDGWARLALGLDTAARRSVGVFQRLVLTELAGDAWDEAERRRGSTP